MEPTLSGTYVTPGGETYAYDGFWSELEKKIRWSAKVRRGGNVVTTPGGVLEGVTKNTDVNRMVKARIETAIQDKINADR